MAERKDAEPDTLTATEWWREGPSSSAQCNFFRALVENVGDIVTLLDRNGTILFHSAAVDEVLGDGAGAVGISIVDEIHPDDRQRIGERLTICAATPDRVLVESFRVQHRDGSWRWMETRATNLIDDPEVGAILCVTRDVTASRRLERQLREAEQLARFGHWRWSKAAPAPQWSEGAAKILDRAGISMPMGGDWHLELIHPDDRDTLLSTLLDVFDTMKPVASVARFRAGDGGYRHIKTHAYVEFDAHDQVDALVGMVEDVTEQIAAEEALRHSEARYRLLAEEASDIIHHTSPDGRMLYVSPSIEAVLGYAPEAFRNLGDNLHHIHPDDRGHVVDNYETLFSGRESIRVEFRMRHSAGHYVWLEATMRSVREKDGRISEIVGVTRDMSERKRNEFELMEARERAEAANLTKSRFLANMSHELRTPLNAIIGFSEMLKLQMFGELGHDRYREYAGLINESGQLLLDLINDVLDMSKVEAGRYELHHEKIDIVEVVDATVRLVRGRAQDENLALRVDLDDGVETLPLVADVRALKQILLNLLSNAIKFTPRGGEVSVGVRKTMGGVIFAVSDTGCGIPNDHLPRLTRPFEQVSTDANLARKGTGLGLALVRSLAELHGGSITIESELGSGTTVEVVLPLVPERIAASAAR